VLALRQNRHQIFEIGISSKKGGRPERIISCHLVQTFVTVAT